MLEKILGLASIGGILSGLTLTKRFIVSAVMIVALAVMGAIIAAALIVFGLYSSYECFIRHGTDPDMAALYSLGIGLVALLIVVGCAACKVKKLQAIPVCSSTASIAGSSVMAMLHGFYRGVTQPPPPPRA